MNRKLLFFALPIFAFMLMACSFTTAAFNRTVVSASGVVKTEQRDVKNVELVSLRGTGDLTIVQGSEEGLTIVADENVMPYIETSMVGNELVIGLKNNVSFTNIGKIKYTLKLKNLNRVSVSGSGNVSSEKLAVNDLALEVSGSGDMSFPSLQAANLTARTSGSGKYDLKGKVKTQDVTISGSGNYNAGDLQSSEAKVTISGSGNVSLWADDKLDVRIAGMGNVSYYGKPTVSQSISGSGVIKSLGNHQ